MNDLIQILRRIVDNRWHKITEQDQDHAARINGECHQLFIKRNNALNIVKYDDNQLYLDDDEWGDIDDDDIDFDDDDKNNEWQNVS